MFGCESLKRTGVLEEHKILNMFYIGLYAVSGVCLEFGT